MDPGGDGGGGLAATGLFCASCGAQSSRTAKICGDCGARLAQDVQSAEYRQVPVLFADVVHSMHIARWMGAARLREVMAELLDGRGRALRGPSGIVNGGGQHVDTPSEFDGEPEVRN